MIWRGSTKDVVFWMVSCLYMKTFSVVEMMVRFYKPICITVFILALRWLWIFFFCSDIHDL